MRLLYPGSFDPPTTGHLSVIRRAAQFAEELVVLVIGNPGKAQSRSVQTRAAWMRACLTDITNARCACAEGLLLDAVKRYRPDALLRGLRDERDYQAEKPVADAFLQLYGVETVFIQCEPSLGFVSSSLARELLALGGDTRAIIPAQIAEAVLSAFRRDHV